MSTYSTHFQDKNINLKIWYELMIKMFIITFKSIKFFGYLIKQFILSSIFFHIFSLRNYFTPYFKAYVLKKLIKILNHPISKPEIVRISVIVLKSVSYLRKERYVVSS